MLYLIFYAFVLASVIDIEYNRLLQWAEHLGKAVKQVPKFGLVAGTGLGSFMDQQLEVDAEIKYEDIPGFPLATAESHSGRFVFGRWRGVPVLVMKGRFHCYEGYNLEQVTLPVRLMKLLGIDKLIVTNAAGGLNPNFQLGDLMIITDHIDLLPGNPLIGRNETRFGPRFPDMSQPYNILWYNLAFETAQQLKIPVRKGVYVAVSGPNLETRAEYRFLRIIGADAVGMSTVPEVIVARHMNMKVLAVSVITDICDLDSLEVLTLEQVIATADKAGSKLAMLLGSLLTELN